jgi:hypothetical protein
MSRIWDALQRIEQQRRDSASEPVAPERIHLTPNQRLALRALLETDSPAEAARLTGVAEITLRRWLTQPGFIAAYYLAGREQLELERARLDAATSDAIEKLQQAREMVAKLTIVADELRRLIPRAVASGAAPPQPDSGAPDAAPNLPRQNNP